MTEHDGKRRFASILGLSTAPAWTAYQDELEKSKGDKLMTKLEELKAAADAANTAANDANDAYDAYDAAYAAAYDAACDADAAANDAWSAYQAELKKTQENNND